MFDWVLNTPVFSPCQTQNGDLQLIKGVLRTQSNNYDEASLQIKLRLFAFKYIRKKTSMSLLAASRISLWVIASKLPILSKYRKKRTEKIQYLDKLYSGICKLYSSATEQNSKQILPIYDTRIKEIIKKINV